MSQKTLTITDEKRKALDLALVNIERLSAKARLCAWVKNPIPA